MNLRRAFVILMAAFALLVSGGFGLLSPGRVSAQSGSVNGSDSGSLGSVVVCFDPAADTYVSSNSPDTNYGSETELLVEAISTFESLSYLRFDLSGVPQDYVVESATLSLYMNWSEYEVETALRPALGAWEEGTITYNNEPERDDVYSAVMHDQNSGWKDWDVTALTQEWVSGERENHGFSIGPDVYPVQAGFTAREGQAGRTPRLCVEFSFPPFLTAEQAKDIVETSDRVEPELLEGSAADAQLVYVIDDTSGVLVPQYWLVLVQNEEGESVGLVGIDPSTGEFGVEIFVDSGYQFPRLNQDQIEVILDDHGIDPADYRIDQAELAFIGGRIPEGNYLLLPHRSGVLSHYLALPAFPSAYTRLSEGLEAHGVLPLFTSAEGRPFYRLDEGLLEQTQQGITQWEQEGDSSPAQGAAQGQVESEPVDLGAGVQSSARPNKARLKKVPLYYQGNTRFCGQSALSMAHQWWTPTDLGTWQSQVNEINNSKYVKIGGFLGAKDPTYPREAEGVMRHWDQVGPYQDFQEIVARKNGSLSDVKWLIGVRKSPVLALVNSDSKSWGFVDHWVLIVGYDDSKNKLWLHNSGAQVGSAGKRKKHKPNGIGTVSYRRWPKYWQGKGLGVNNTMIAGRPSDGNAVSWTERTPTFPRRISDGEQLQISDVGLTIDNGEAMDGSDIYGDTYSTTAYLGVKKVACYTCTVQLKNVVDGGFDGHSTSTTVSGTLLVTYTHHSGLAPIPQGGKTIGNASLAVDPVQLGSYSVKYGYKVHDEDRRWHAASETVQVHDHRKGGLLNMPKPVLREFVRKGTKYVEVVDDDRRGPTILNYKAGKLDYPTPSNIDDEHPGPNGNGAIRLKAWITDSSGLGNITFHYKVLAPDGSVAVPERTERFTTSKQGVVAHADIPKSQWIGNVGGKVNWWVVAEDADADRPGDASAARSPTPWTIKLEDDDTHPPSFHDHDASSRVVSGKQGKKTKYVLKVKLSDVSGVLDDAAYPRIYYDWSTPITRSDNYTDASLDGVWYRVTITASIGKRDDTLYWRVEAKDNDADRSGDQATGFSNTYSVTTPPKLCVAPNPPNHDFGMLSNRIRGKFKVTWPFTVTNCGGQTLGLTGKVSQRLQRIRPSGGKPPECPPQLDHCWMELDEGAAPNLYLKGGHSGNVTVTLNAQGFDYQVDPLRAGEYEGEIHMQGWRAGSSAGSSSGTSATGTIKAAIPQITVTAPHKGVAWEHGETHTVTWRSAYMSAGANVKLQITRPSSHVIASSVANTGSFTWTVPASGIQDGQHRVKVSPVGLPTMAGQSEPFWIGNAPPNRPTNQSPPDKAQGISSPPTLRSSTFTDPNTGETHQASQWQLRGDTFGTSQYRSPRWDSMTDTQNLTSTTVPAGVLAGMAKAETKIRVEVGEHFFAPSEINVTRGQRVTLTVENVGNQAHSLRIPQIEVSTSVISPGQSAQVTFTPRGAGELSFHCAVSNHQQLGEHGWLEVKESTYWWRVRHQDSEGLWSQWSAETRFSIVYRPPVSLPAGLLNFGQVIADFRRLSNLTITYAPLGRIDIGLGGASGMRAESTQNDEPLRYTGVAFDLTARDQNGESVIQFDEPYTLTVSYEDWQWRSGGIGSEGSLNLYWNADQGWEPVLPCEGCGHDMEENVIVARLDHLTEFALMGEPTAPIYLPLVLKGF